MQQLTTRSVQLTGYTHDRGDFHRVRDRNVLIYWPHGFGDWVQFSVVAPFLESSNRYWMTRFGDDSVSLMQGHPSISPAYLGVNSPHCDDGGRFGIKHFGVRYDEIQGDKILLQAPLSLYHLTQREEIDSLLWTWYPETYGSSAPPYHTKARSIARALVSELPARFSAPLPCSINLDEDPALVCMVEARLRNFCGYGERKLCLLARGGYTSVGKNWGHMWREDVPGQHEGAECRDFIRGVLAKDPNWCFLLMEDRNFADSIKDPQFNTFAYADLFGEPEASFAPFGRIMKCLARVASLCVGVPAGPYHLAAQVSELPTVGVWIEHLPSWYDEPRQGLVHVIGSKAVSRVGEPGSFLRCNGFEYDSIVLDTRIIPGEAVMAAAETLLSGGDWRGSGPTVSLPPRGAERLEQQRLVDEFLQRVPPYPEERFEGLGVVICGGGAYWPSAWVAINRLRRSGCQLPIQLWYLGADEMAAGDLSRVRKLDVECVDATEVRKRHPTRILRGWELKPYSILHSRFAKVLYIDADNLAVRDPTYLFQSEGYLRCGAMFWPDRVRLAPDREIWDIFRVPYRDEPEFESGQILIDKQRSWRAMQLSMHINEHSDFYYRYMYGDKDTYHMAWRFLGHEYAVAPHPPRHIDDVFHQHDESGEKVFQHGVKWRLDQPHRPRAEYMWQEECVQWLAALHHGIDIRE